MQKVLEQIQTERGIMTEAWYILKHNVGIEKKDSEAPSVAAEWEALVKECEKLYNTKGNAAQEKLAKAVALALMDYYGELSKPAERS